MPIAVLCSECNHEWNERPSKAGSSVECPECDAKNRVTRTAQRPPSQPWNTSRLVLIASCILLVGVLGMLAFKLAPILITEDDTDLTPTAVPDESADPDVEVITDASVQEHAAAATDHSAETRVDVSPAAPVESPTEQTPGTAGRDVSVTNTDRGRQLMAEMSDIGITVSPFTADVRGTVTDAVRSAVSDAIEKCRVTVRAPNAEPVMRIDLKLRDDQLVMSAKLMALDQQRPVCVWQRSGTVTTVTEKATETGIIPTNLHRDVEAFFKGLRLEFQEARRQFTP